MPYVANPEARSVAEVRGRISQTEFFTSSIDLRRVSEPVKTQQSNHYYSPTFVVGSYSDALNAHLKDVITVDRKTLAMVSIFRFISNPLANSGVDELSETVEAGLDFVNEFGPDSLVLSGLHPKGVNAEHLAALLRATSSWRTNIQGWDEAISVAKRSAEASGLEPRDVLFGMI